MNRLASLSVLIIDDDPDLPGLYRQVLQHGAAHQVECVCSPGEAMRLVRSRLFDLVIVDAKILYHGAPLGGLLLAEEIATVLGFGSVLLISQYDVREEIARFNPEFAFLPKPRAGGSLLGWVERDLTTKMAGIIRRQYGFVVMPYNDDGGDRWYRETLTTWMREVGFEVRRMDELPTTRAINSELQERIRQAHFVVVFLPQKNANVYFEAGFATALDKYLLLFSHDLERLPFDVRLNQCFPVTTADDHEARGRFTRFMTGLRGFEQVSSVPITGT